MKSHISVKLCTFKLHFSWNGSARRSSSCFYHVIFVVGCLGYVKLVQVRYVDSQHRNFINQWKDFRWESHKLFAPCSPLYHLFSLYYISHFHNFDRFQKIFKIGTYSCHVSLSVWVVSNLESIIVPGYYYVANILYDVRALTVAGAIAVLSRCICNS